MADGIGALHVPQQSRREKLRFTSNDVVHHQLYSSPYAARMSSFGDILPWTTPENRQVDVTNSGDSMAATVGLNLSLSTHSRTQSGPILGFKHKSAVMAAPIGPFTGYASILSRSRFLRPAQELLEAFCGPCRGTVENFDETSNILEDSGGWCDDDVARCGNTGLLSLLHEVYKRYKLYCQQMHSAVTSFQTVAGLGNAAPFICFAIKAMSKHFHCLKNAILDHIQVTSKTSRSKDIQKGGTPGSYAGDQGHSEQKQVPSNFLQHPVWRSQRGFPDKAVAVLKTWLFENFLHPYPSDSDKQMLAQKTGLSRNQVSNWFTNARVRLWKPMVEEMHMLEKHARFPSHLDNEKPVNAPNGNHLEHPYYSEKDFRDSYTQNNDQENHTKRSRVESCSQKADPNKEQYSLMGNILSHNQLLGPDTSALGSNPDNTTGLSWSNHGEVVPFWLAKW